jgi:hypothetical protein
LEKIALLIAQYCWGRGVVGGVAASTFLGVDLTGGKFTTCVRGREIFSWHKLIFLFSEGSGFVTKIAYPFLKV